MATKRYKLGHLEVFDVAEHLCDEELIALYLEEAAKWNDAELMASALDDVERARKRWGLLPPAA